MPLITFKGKTIIQSHHLTVPYRTLVPDKRASLTERPTLDDNLIVHGDNLHALKALLPSFSGKVKCIYIDPPYNTGNEGWVYNDNVNSPMHQEWLAKAVARDDLTRHDKWLCMMYPRLRLLHELLRQDGAIFISIDDNEVHRLRILMDEIFGEECFKNAIIFRRGAKNVQAQFETVDSLTVGHEYVLMYSKSPETRFPKLMVELEEEKEGSWNNHWRGTDRPTMRYPLFGETPQSGQWRWKRSRSEEAIENYLQMLQELGITESEFPLQEQIDEWYKSKVEETGEELDLLRLSQNGKPEHYIAPSTESLGSDLWTDISPKGSAELKQIFGRKVFDNPKPVNLIRRILSFMTSPDTEDIILDSFAGSGTTGHAVLAMNAEDGGNRRFILIEQEAYADTLTAERIRRVIKGVPKAKDEALAVGYDGMFSFFRLGDALDEERLLTGNQLPSYMELARYAFFTATGEQLDETQVDERRYYLGESKRYEVYMLYAPDRDFLLKTPLNLSWAQSLGAPGEKTRLVIASHKYLDDHKLRELKMEYAQLPFAIYRFQV